MYHFWAKCLKLPTTSSRFPFIIPTFFSLSRLLHSVFFNSTRGCGCVQPITISKQNPRKLQPFSRKIENPLVCFYTTVNFIIKILSWILLAFSCAHLKNFSILQITWTMNRNSIRLFFPLVSYSQKLFHWPLVWSSILLCASCIDNLGGPKSISEL